MDREGVKAKFDVYPEQIIDYLALVGDSSDNIPGIEKVGPKTAAKLLNQYGTLDGLIAHVHEVEGRVGENLRAGLEILELSRKLATISTDLELPLSIEQLVRANPDIELLRQLYNRYELRSLLRQLEGNDPGDKASAQRAMSRSPARRRPLIAEAAPLSPLAAVPKRYETITQWADLERWIEALKRAELFAFDTETTSPDYMKAQIVGVSFSIEPGVAAYVPVSHDYAGAPEQLDRGRVLEALKPLLEDSASIELLARRSQ